MFIRRVNTRPRSDDEHTFSFRLVRSERDGDQVRQRTLLNLGRHFDVDRGDWPALCQRIETILTGQVSLAPGCWKRRRRTWPPTNCSPNSASAPRCCRSRSSRSHSEQQEPLEPDMQTVDINSLRLVRSRSVGVEQVGLWAMDLIIGGIDIQDQALWRLRERLNEPLQEHLMQSHRVLPTGLLLKATQRRSAGQLLIRLDCRWHRPIVTQLLMIIEILIAHGQAKYPLSDQGQQGVPTTGLATTVIQHGGYPLGQSQSFVSLAYQHDTAVRSDISTIKRGFHQASFAAGETGRLRMTNRHGSNIL